MKPVLRSWPYLAGVLAAYLGWLGVTGLNASGDSLVTLYAGTVVPIGLAAGGAVLGYRRGYDWVTVLICVIAGVALLAWGVRLTPDALLAAAVAYTGVAHVGLVAALGIAALGGKPPAKQG